MCRRQLAHHVHILHALLLWSPRCNHDLNRTSIDAHTATTMRLVLHLLLLTWVSAVRAESPLNVYTSCVMPDGVTGQCRSQPRVQAVPSDVQAGAALELPVDMRLPCADANRTCAEVRAQNSHIIKQQHMAQFDPALSQQQQHSDGPAWEGWLLHCCRHKPTCTCTITPANLCNVAVPADIDTSNSVSQSWAGQDVS